MFLIALAMRPAAAVFYWCQRWLPSNRLVTLLRTRRGYRWGLPAVLLGVLGCVKLRRRSLCGFQAAVAVWA
ncbi:hypothetical protein GCM10027064_26510 [Microbacterium petrolearium]